MSAETSRPQPAGPVAVQCGQGHPMVERINTHTGGSFLGCSRYPECTETRQLPLHLKLLRQGYQPLPGWEAL